MPYEEKVTLQRLARGAAEEQFNDVLEQVLANIADPNTEPDARRELTLRLVFQPDDSREVAQVTISTSSKLAGRRSIGTNFYLGHDGERHVALEWNPKQGRFDFEKPKNIRQIDGGNK